MCDSVTGRMTVSMFTGIIAAVGQITAVERQADRATSFPVDDTFGDPVPSAKPDRILRIGYANINGFEVEFHNNPKRRHHLSDNSFESIGCMLNGQNKRVPLQDSSLCQ